MLHCGKYYFVFFSNMSSLNEGVGMTPRAFSLHLTCFGPLSIHPLVFLSPLIRRSGSRGCCSLYPANLVWRQGYILDIQPSTLTRVPTDNLPIAGVLGLWEVELVNQAQRGLQCEWKPVLTTAFCLWMLGKPQGQQRQHEEALCCSWQ